MDGISNKSQIEAFNELLRIKSNFSLLKGRLNIFLTEFKFKVNFKIKKHIGLKKTGFIRKILNNLK
jgi:hypothetical protein